VKAAVIYEYGGPDVFRIEDIPEPVISSTEVLVQVYAASVNPVDWKQRKGNHKRFLKGKFPIVPGYDVSGVIVRCGDSVRKFSPGDQVCCRLTRRFGGAFAEYAAAPESVLAMKPDSIEHLHAAAMPLAGITALQALRDKGRIKPGMEIMILGAAGGVGHFALQLARHFGAKVTAVCSSRHESMMKELRPDFVIDYTVLDYKQLNKHYDIIFDAAGVESFLSCRRILNPGGIYITSLPRPKLLIHKVVSIFTKGLRVRTLLMRSLGKDLEFLIGLMLAGKVKPFIDSVFPLERVSDAHRKAEQYSTEGKILIRVR
jgi:NADPH:quinone reductase-like Zn-dependent oxidoreductase